MQTPSGAGCSTSNEDVAPTFFCRIPMSRSPAAVLSPWWLTEGRHCRREEGGRKAAAADIIRGRYVRNPGRNQYPRVLGPLREAAKTEKTSISAEVSDPRYAKNMARPAL